MSWLEDKADDLAEQACGEEQPTLALSNAIVAIAQEYAKRSIKSMSVVRPDISPLRKGCWVAEIGRSQFGLPDILAALQKRDDFINEALVAANAIDAAEMTE